MKSKPQALRLDIDDKRDVRTQFGALCYRKHEGQLQILLVTSRGTGRWIIPKGWPMDGETPSGAATTEAYEEAGVKGKTSPVVLGIYSYTKSMPKSDNLPCIVAVFALKVKQLLKDYPESTQRRRKWFSVKRAADLVDEPELGQLIRDFKDRLT